MEEYFSPVDSMVLLPEVPYVQDDLFHGIKIYDRKGRFPVFEKNTIVIIGVGEERGAKGNKGCADGIDNVRLKLYKLKQHSSSADIADFGNLIPGSTLEDTYAALAHITAELYSQKAIPVVIGGSQDFSKV